MTHPRVALYSIYREFANKIRKFLEQSYRPVQKRGFSMAHFWQKVAYFFPFSLRFPKTKTFSTALKIFWKPFFSYLSQKLRKNEGVSKLSHPKKARFKTVVSILNKESLRQMLNLRGLETRDINLKLIAAAMWSLHFWTKTYAKISCLTCVKFVYPSLMKNMTSFSNFANVCLKF